jgi:hypothetical protein
MELIEKRSCECSGGRHARRTKDCVPLRRILGFGPPDAMCAFSPIHPGRKAGFALVRIRASWLIMWQASSGTRGAPSRWRCATSGLKLWQRRAEDGPQGFASLDALLAGCDAGIVALTTPFWSARWATLHACTTTGARRRDQDTDLMSLRVRPGRLATINVRRECTTRISRAASLLRLGCALVAAYTRTA